MLYFYQEHHHNHCTVLAKPGVEGEDSDDKCQSVLSNIYYLPRHTMPW